MDKTLQLKTLRTKYVEIGKEIAGLESTKKSLDQQKVEFINKCKSLGVSPKEIDKKVQELTDQFNTLIQQISDALNPNINKSTEDVNDEELDNINNMIDDSLNLEEDDILVFPDDEEAI